MSLYFALLTVENNKNKKSIKFQGDLLIFCDFIRIFVFTTQPSIDNYPEATQTIQKLDMA